MKKDDRKTPEAIALKYQAPGAPMVVAKGRGETARQIEMLAKEHDVATISDSGLAELLAFVPLDSEIPESLYQSVAEVLIFVYSLAERQ